MPTMEGIITLVQESRFQIRDDGGTSHLFLLGPHAAAEPSDLTPLAARQARVRIDYRDGENVIGAVARDVYVLADHGERS